MLLLINLIFLTSGRRQVPSRMSAMLPRAARRSRAELALRAELLDELRAIARKSPLTLVFAARDELHNQAVV